MTKVLHCEKGSVSVFTVFFLLSLIILLALFMTWTGTEVTMLRIRNAMQAELNNLAIRISDDTYQAMRENDLDAYYKRLTTSTTYQNINSMLASINSYLDFSNRNDCKVKVLKLQKEVYRSEEKELTKSEYERLCKTAELKKNERLSLLLQTICGTGIRVSELRFITVEAVKAGEAVVSCKGKTRTVFLVKYLKKKLLRYAAEQKIVSGCIFVTRNGMPMNRTNIWREMKNFVLRQG